MKLDIQKIKSTYFQDIKKCWKEADIDFPNFLKEVPYAKKNQNEQYIQSISDKFHEEFNKFSRLTVRKKDSKQKISLMVREVLREETIIGIHQSMDEQTLDAYQEELIEFLRHARTFSPNLSFEGIGQAIRNYIVYIIFNELNQGKPGFNIACFGYSMLYPFTDNYIDSELHTPQEKQNYNQLIRNKLEGKEVSPSSYHQCKTCELLDKIEISYPRDLDCTIYTLLLAMLDAQEVSLNQCQELNLDEILDISLYKGGISVLIDRFFVQKEITVRDLLFYLEFGLFLQLADDLQDIKEDSEKGSKTLFTADLNCKSAEQLVNKMLHFLYQMTNSYPSANEPFKQFILSNCYQLIYSSIVGSKEFFSQEYLGKLECFFPVTFPFLEEMYHNRLDKIDIHSQERYLKLLDELLIQP